jgi:hypothetical protein
MMKRSVLLSLALAISLLPLAAFAQQAVFMTTLAGANEPGGGDADGYGVGLVTISGTTLNFIVTANNLSNITGTHIHRGSTSAIVIPFQPTGQSVPTYTNNVATGTITGIDQSLINEIIANPSAFYLNVHSSEKPGGAIRGSLTGFSNVLGSSIGAAGSENPSTCVENDTTMCVNGGKFRVQATWTTSDGATGAGHAVRLTADTGYFWFFNSSNVEMTVKVLNACSIGTTQWVFASGLTNVQVALKVTDTRSGVTKTYTNPNGTSFMPVQDTAAFSCP